MFRKNRHFNADLKNFTQCSQLNTDLQKSAENEEPMEVSITKTSGLIYKTSQ